MAVSHCHSHNVAHRDIQPENILLEYTESGHELVKIIDFGTSIKYEPDGKIMDTVGTPYYMAPDVFNTHYTNKCDVWSCGVILYLLLSGGKPPFNGYDDYDIIRAVK